MGAGLSPIRKIEQSLAIHVRNGLSGLGWNNHTVVQEFPDGERSLPCIAIECDMFDKFPMELGTQFSGTEYDFVVHVFAKNKGQREDLVYSLCGDEDMVGVLDKTLPVYDVAGAYTGAYLFPVQMKVEDANLFSTGDDPMNKWRAAIRLTASRT